MEENAFEQAANFVSDRDWEWGPFLFLRPEPHRRMSSLRVLALAALYGVFAGLLANAVLVLAGHARTSFNPLLFPAGATLGFFAIYRSTFAYFWNRRAARLERLLRRSSR